jgi:putative glutamine amidotransferase
VALGGDMIQDLPGQKSQLIQHSQRAPRSHASHTIEIEENSLLHQIFKKTSIKVNSFHHQAVRFVPSTFKVTARSADGVIEAFESLIHAFVLGVQWHPESMAKIDADSRQLFQAFVNVATAL